MLIPLRARAARRVLLPLAITTLSLSWSAAARAQAATPPRRDSGVIVVAVSANAEWKVVKAAAIADYATAIDLGWLGTALPAPVRRTVLVSADRDLVPAELAELKARYGAVAGDWESGAIACTCARNAQRVLILRGVSDLVTAGSGGEAYGNPQVFEQGTRTVMTSLLEQLPKWLAMVR